MLMCFLFIYFFFIWYILYSWVGELKRRKKATAVLYNKQTRRCNAGPAFFFSCLVFCFCFCFFISVYIPGFLFFFFYFHPHQPPTAFYDCDVPSFCLCSIFFLFIIPLSPIFFFFFSFFSVNFCGKKKAFAMVLIP